MTAEGAGLLHEAQARNPTIGDPKDHITIRIPQTMISGIPLVLGLETRM